MNKKIINVLCITLFSLSFASSNVFASSTLSFDILTGGAQDPALSLSYAHNESYVHNNTGPDLTTFNQTNSVLTVVWNGVNFNGEVNRAPSPEQTFFTEGPFSNFASFETTFVNNIINTNNPAVNVGNGDFQTRGTHFFRLVNFSNYNINALTGNYQLEIGDPVGTRLARYLDENSTIGNVLFNGENPSVVPVPAAAWLFGSALLGFFGFSRRKKLS